MSFSIATPTAPDSASKPPKLLGDRRTDEMERITGFKAQTVLRNSSTSTPSPPTTQTPSLRASRSPLSPRWADLDESESRSSSPPHHTSRGTTPTLSCLTFAVSSAARPPIHTDGSVTPHDTISHNVSPHHSGDEGISTGDGSTPRRRPLHIISRSTTATVSAPFNSSVASETILSGAACVGHSYGSSRASVDAMSDSEAPPTPPVGPTHRRVGSLASLLSQVHIPPPSAADSHTNYGNNSGPSLASRDTISTHFGMSALVPTTVTERPSPRPVSQSLIAHPFNGANLRVSVPITDASGQVKVCDRTGMARCHGYAGAVSMMQSTEMSPQAASLLPRISAVLSVDMDSRVKRMVRNVANGLRAQQDPEQARDGMGGTYFMRDDTGKMSAIFKPCDEEPFAPNNPKGWDCREMGAPGMKPCVRVGEAALREVAAYLLDHDGFAGVPCACLVTAYHPSLSYKVRVSKIESLVDLASHSELSSHQNLLKPVCEDGVPSPAPSNTPPPPPPSLADTAAYRRPRVPTARPPKLGSLQQFVSHTCDANDISPSRFATSNVHRIGILDIRLLNCDRHAGNLLVGRSKMSRAESGYLSGFGADTLTIVPIDHGYSLPEALDNPYFEWLYWPQASLPFGEAELEYIANLSIEDDIALLRRLLPSLREESLRTLSVTTTVLQRCAAAGLTLFEIGTIMTRSDGYREELPSDLEVMCMDAREEAIAVPSDETWAENDALPHANSATFLSPLAKLPSLAETDEHGDLQSDPMFFNMDTESTPSALDFTTPASLARGLAEDDFLWPRSHESDNTLTRTADCEGPLRTISWPDGGEGGGGLYSACGTSEADGGGLFSPTSPFESPPPKWEGSDLVQSQYLMPATFNAAPRLQCGVVLDAFSCRAGDSSLGAHGYVLGRGTTMDAPAAPRLVPTFGSDDGHAELYSENRLSTCTLNKRVARRRLWRTKQVARTGRTAYPALLVGDHPDQVNYLFSGLTAQQWSTFIAAVRESCDEEILNGTWTKMSTSKPVCGSCPSFSKHGFLSGIGHDN